MIGFAESAKLSAHTAAGEREHDFRILGDQAE
jgi:hypothetical protein